MKSASSDTDTKSDALSRMLSSIRPHMVMLHAFSATCARQRGSAVSHRVHISGFCFGLRAAHGRAACVQRRLHHAAGKRGEP